jgi:predicted acyltransferase (DUF342 family)
MVGIYKIISPSGKIYIGQTSNWIKRVKKYSRVDCKGQVKLYNSLKKYGFETLQDPVMVKDKGFLLIDHLTNNVYKGTMEEWATFYKNVFGFEEVRVSISRYTFFI